MDLSVVGAAMPFRWYDIWSVGGARGGVGEATMGIEGCQGIRSGNR